MKWVNKSMDKKNLQIIPTQIAFNLPLQLFCIKAKNIRESRKRNTILKYLCPHIRCVAPKWFTS